VRKRLSFWWIRKIMSVVIVVSWYIVNVHSGWAEYINCSLPGTSFVCNVCGNVYTRANILRKHIAHAHTGIRFTCNICHQALGNRSILYHHYFSHRGFKPYHCPECSHEDLTKHRRLFYIVFLFFFL
jgi:hypothetical protein